MNTPALPPIWYAGKRVARTVFQFLIVAVPIFNLAAAAVIDYLRTQEDVAVPAWAFAALNAVLAATALIIGLATKIMAIPQINDLFAKIGLGSVPTSRLAGGAALPDPKASTREEYQAALNPREPNHFRDPGAHNQP